MLKPLGDVLKVLQQHLLELPGDIGVVASKERNSQTSVPRPAGSANPVNVVINMRGEVEIHHAGHVIDVQATGGHISRHQDRNYQQEGKVVFGEQKICVVEG